MVTSSVHPNRPPVAENERAARRGSALASIKSGHDSDADRDTLTVSIEGARSSASVSVNADSTVQSAAFPEDSKA